MKRPIFILSSLLCVYSIQYAVASDSLEETQPVEVLAVEEESNTPDNVQISDAKYMRDTIDKFAGMQARVSELLIPEESTQDLWIDDAVVHNSASVQSVMLAPMEQRTERYVDTGVSLGDQRYYGETVYIINNFLSGAENNIFETSESYAGVRSRPEYSKCPFNTVSECAVWVRKPVVSEVVAPRSTNLRKSVMADVAGEIETTPNISANEPSMAPLFNRYRVLLRASQSCCTGGITYKMHKGGASQKSVYKFLSDDANFSGFASRCLVMNDNQIENTDKYQVPSATIMDVRNECLCKSKTNFKALLAPFEQLYKAYPAFADAPFEYKHYDGVGRYVTDSVNMDVQNVLNQLEMCP